MKTLTTVVSLLLLSLSAPLALANAWTPFVENMVVGQTATHRCEIVPSGFDKDWEYFTVIVHSDTGDVYGLHAKAKPGVVDLDLVRRQEPCNITAKLLKVTAHKTKRIVTADLEISRVKIPLAFKGL